MKNIPNIMSVFRILLVPLFIWLYFSGNPVWLAAAVVILAAATDVADGFIARKYNLVTVTGQVLDPLADKLMQLSVIITLWVDDKIPKWAIALIAAKELIMIIGGCILYFFKKKTAIPAEWYGKAATVLFYITMLYIIILNRVDYVATILIVMTVALMMSSLVRYFAHFVRLAKKDKVSV